MAIAAVGTMGLASCSLDEYNPHAGSSTLKNFQTWEGLQTQCYSTLYHELYSKPDFLFVSECGTDLWLNPSGTDYAPEVFYYKGLGVARQEPRKTWQQAYSVIATCNSVIAEAGNVDGGDEEAKKVLAAEAKAIRAFMHLTLTTYFGQIPLSTAVVGENNTAPKRNTLEEIYTSITTDLKEAAQDLGDQPYGGNYARVCKKTAYGLLARAYAQGAGEGLSENGVSYWQRAKEVAEGMINEPAKYGLTGNELYNDVSDLWAQDNNRGSVNKEYLFVAAGLDATGVDAANAGTYFNATSYLYAFQRCNPNVLQDIFNIQPGSNYTMGNHNQTGVMAPTKHAIDVFGDWDKRYENTFMTAFSPFTLDESSANSYTRRTIKITQSMANKYNLGEMVYDAENDEDVNPVVGKSIYPYAALAQSTANGGTQVYAKGVYAKGGKQKIEPTKNALVMDMPLAEDEDRVSIYLYKGEMTPESKAKRAYVCMPINDLYGVGSDYDTDYRTDMYKFKTLSTNANKLFPCLIKYNALYNGSTRQLANDGYPFRNGDIAIMRMAEVYLIAAEAETMLGNGGEAARYIKPLHDRAVRPGFTAPAITNVDEDYILDEYAREFCGEHMRWAVLKRHHALKKELSLYNKRAAASFDESIHYNRPIPQLFLDQIKNKEEFGDNGYGYTGTKGY